MHTCETCGYFEQYIDNPMYGYCHFYNQDYICSYGCPKHTDYFDYEHSLWQPPWYNNFYDEDDRGY